MSTMRRDREFRAFPKRWGAEYVREGQVLFRIWAPGVTTMTLRLSGVDAEMGAVGDGWFELLAEGVEPGTEYAFVLPDGLAVPDPAAREQAADVHGPSRVVDPTAYRWRNTGWTGRPWEEAMIYELHVGTFTPEGTFAAAREKLARLAELGITAIEVMPVAQFAGDRGWGYDGVLPYAPHPAYGTPEDMKAFVDAAHDHGLMVLLDVVYNHFGPDGSYLHACAEPFFDAARHTPWGAGIDYRQPAVRSFFLDNALYWLDEFYLDGLRFDAIDQIGDGSEPHLLAEIAQAIRHSFPERHIHLTTEDNRNVTHLHRRDADGRAQLFTGEWNDDFHNVAHVIATGEHEGYYEDFSKAPLKKLARALAEGFVYQGEPSAHAGGKPRGEPSLDLPPAAFVDFLQNHDQTGNRAFGERLLPLAGQTRTRALMALLLLSPHIPLLFMGEEYGETRPFLFFTDFHGELADAVREGRRREFAGFAAFAGGDDRDAIPDPNAPSTLEASRLDWQRRASAEGENWTAFTRTLLDLRRTHIVPLIPLMGARSGRVLADADGMVAVEWRAGDTLLTLHANLSDRPLEALIEGTVLHRHGPDAASGQLLPWSVVLARATAGARTP
jgi:malto-oligosyltrehalose trehalohydrolase